MRGGSAAAPAVLAKGLAALLLAWAALAAMTAPSRAAEDPAVRAFVEELNAQSIALMADGDEAAARKRCRALLDSRFDIPGMAEFALARAWDKASPQKRAAYVDAFREEVITAYLRRMQGQGTALTYIGSRPPLKGDLLAASRLTRPGKDDQTWIWRLHPDGKSWRIVDLLVDGHSAVFAEATHYYQILEANNGDVGAVIAYLRKQAAKGLQAP